MDWFKTWCTRPTWQQLRRVSDGGYRLFYEARYHLSVSESIDGRISSEQLAFLGPFGTLDNAAALVMAGLWADDPDDGWCDVSWASEQDEMGRLIKRKEGNRTRQQRKRDRDRDKPPSPPSASVTPLSRVTSREGHARREEEKREEERGVRGVPFPDDFREQVEQARLAKQAAL